LFDLAIRNDYHFQDSFLNKKENIRYARE